MSLCPLMGQFGRRSTCVAAIFSDKCPNEPDSIVAFYNANAGYLSDARDGITIECIPETGKLITQ